MKKNKPNKTLPNAEHRPLPLQALSMDEPVGAVRGRNAIRPTITSAFAIQSLTKVLGELEIRGLVDALDVQTKSAISGDLGRAEAMLITQAHTLDTLFTQLTVRGASNMSEYLDSADKYFRLALKAQAQCARTLEVLAAIKNPPIVYAKQANIANGPQQVNNGIPSRTQENEIEQTKLSGSDNELLPNTRASEIEGRVNQEVETMGEVHGAEVKRG